ncbi:MAG: DUF1178 family protein [Alphaproteobacteria bacterium]|nr:DUF1178 family protein [Alphaproteobacteria bacterium]
MKVLDLHCEHQHEFEGWFGSEDNFQSQLSRQLVQCPVCASHVVTKRLSAPRLNLSGAREPAALSTPTDAPPATAEQVSPAELQAAWLKMVRHIMAHTVDVGDQFAQEARKIHYGEAEQRQIRGQVSGEETREMLEEGIAVMPLPIPEALKGPLQ